MHWKIRKFLSSSWSRLFRRLFQHSFCLGSYSHCEGAKVHTLLDTTFSSNFTILKEISIHWKYAQDSILAKLIQIPRLGLVMDMDGTISPIVAHPEEAKIPTNIKKLLAGLSANLFLVGVISGRAVEDIVHRVGVSDLIYIGNHGFERWINGESVIHPQAAQFRLALEAAMEDIRLLPELRAGMYIEDKGATISIHYRQSRLKKFVNEKVKPKIQAVAKRHQLVFSEGRMVFELRPPIKINKGTAFEKIVEEHKLDAALFIGDDITDIPALLKSQELRKNSKCLSYGIGVKSGERSVLDASDFFASDIPDVEVLLSWLLMARKESSVGL